MQLKKSRSSPRRGAATWRKPPLPRRQISQSKKMETYKVTRIILRKNVDGTEAQERVVVKSGLTWVDAKNMQKENRTLSISQEYPATNKNE